MYTEVEAFIAARDEALCVYDEKLRDLQSRRSEYMTSGNCGCSNSECLQGGVSPEYTTLSGGIRTEQDVTVNTAWNRMKLDSADPLVGWIVDNCKDYQSEALVILSALPASAEELEQIGNDQSWCHIWTQFLEQAQNAGVLPGSVPLSPARQELVTWFRNQVTSHAPYRRTLLTMVDAVVAESTATPADAAAE